jgi:PGF-pre-PGF domain-containing protein
MVKGRVLSGVLVLFLLPVLVSATVTVNIYQTDRDPGSVIAGKTFTVTASGWSGSCSSAIIDLTECAVCNISESTSKSISGSSVSWDKLMATSTESTQKITVSVSGTCTPDSGYTEFTAKTAPVISDSVSPSSVSVTQGSTFTLSINILNSGETTAEGSITVSPSSQFSISDCPFTSIPGGQSMGMNCEIAASSSATVGTQDATLTITTTQGNEIAKSVEVTVSAAPTEDGGVSAGGGGGAAGAPSKRTVVNVTRGKAVITVPSIAAGKMANVSIERAKELGVTEIIINVKNSVNNIKITITKKAKRPAEVKKEITGKVYQYLKIDKENIEDENISSVTIGFRVEKSWISANNIKVSTIALYRWSDNKWGKLETRKISEDGTDVYFQAESPGLSVFAIGGVKTEEAVIKECSSCPEATDWSECAEGKQRRTNYRCSEETDYECIGYTEEKSCEVAAPLAPEISYSWIIAAIMVIAVVLLLVLRRRYKGS